MWPFSSRNGNERLWLAEATAGALETAARAPDIDEILAYWAKEISTALRPVRIALFVLEGGRWAIFGVYCLVFAAVMFFAAWRGL